MLLSIRQMQLVAAIALVLAFSLYFTTSSRPWAGLASPIHDHATRPTAPSKERFPRKIWQTWKVPVQELEHDTQAWTQTWVRKNPSHRYELLTDLSAVEFIRDSFQGRQDILDIWSSINDAVLRADLLRYLVLLAEGGVYTDIDTECDRPIDEWISSEHQASAELVVGIEYDRRDGEIRGDFAVDMSFVQWTIMAKAGSRALDRVVSLVLDRLAAARNNETGHIHAATALDVLNITGPISFTQGIMTSLGITWENVTKLETPRLIEEVLFLPVSAFATGQDHSGSKDWGNEEQLITHRWRGSWHEGRPDEQGYWPGIQ